MTPGSGSQPPSGPQLIFSSMLRGFARHCPRCGKGLLFDGYLRPNAACANCREQTGQIYTADVAPYFTILLVGHIIVPLLLVTEQLATPPPFLLQIAVWPILALALTLWFLPRVKGSTMGLMWALGMRGHERQ